MAFPTTAIPVGHFQGLGNLSGNEADSLRNLLNRVRESLDFGGGYQVDKSDPNKFQSIPEAFAAAVIAEASGAEVKISIAKGTYPENADFGTDHPVILESVTHKGAKITGNLTFGNYAALTRHEIRGCDLNGNTVTVKDGTILLCDTGGVTSTAFVLDPTAGAIGYEVYLQNCDVVNPTITETAAPAASLRNFTVDGQQATFTSGAGTPISIYKLRLYFANIGTQNLEWAVFTNPLIDANSDSPSVTFTNFAVKNFHLGGVPQDWFTNAGSCAVEFNNATFQAQASGKSMAFGTLSGTLIGVPIIVSHNAPLNVPDGTIWRDETNHRTATYVFDATYPYWKWSSWKIGEALVDSGLGDVTASTGAFGVINDAYNALTAALGTEQPMFLKLVNGLDYTLTASALTIGAGRSVHIGGVAPEGHDADHAWFTRIIGTITLAVADGASERLTLGLHDCVLDGDINGTSNWLISMERYLHDSGHIINRTHGANGCQVFGSRFRSTGGQFKIIDTDANADGNVWFEESHISFGFASNVCFDFAGAITGWFKNCVFDCFSTVNNAMFDFASAACNFSFYGCTMLPFINGGTVLSVAANGGSGTLLWVNTKVEVTSGGSLDPSAGTVSGALVILSDVAPINPYPTLTWIDRDLDDSLVWDGTYWGNGTIFRKDLLVDVDAAAVSHTTGWTVPAGAGVLNTSANALKNLTAGGGATLFGISDGSDGDKFAESTALVQNSKASAKQASINVGAGDTIYVHSMTSTGVEGGTLAGSNDSDVRVVVYFTMPKTLPSV